jgi:hypothetical protein
MADILIVDQKKEEPQQVSEQHEGVSAPVQPELVRSSREEAMGLESSQEKHRYQDKIDTLMQYVKTQTQDLSPENVKWIIRSLELKLGTPPFSERRINYVAQYAYLCMETKRLEKDKEKFTKGGWT